MRAISSPASKARRRLTTRAFARRSHWRPTAKANGSICRSTSNRSRRDDLELLTASPPGAGAGDLGINLPLCLVFVDRAADRFIERPAERYSRAVRAARASRSADRPQAGARAASRFLARAAGCGGRVLVRYEPGGNRRRHPGPLAL